MKCACGCNEDIIPKKHHEWNPVKFKKGHWAKKSSLWKGSSHWSWKGGIRYINGYRYIWNPNHHFASKQGYISEHRLVWEKENNAVLLPCVVIHHKNKNILDNRIENLEVMSWDGHSRFHRLNP